jgi:hypothetical protein
MGSAFVLYCRQGRSQIWKRGGGACGLAKGISGYIFAAKELYAELVALSYTQMEVKLLVRKSLDGCGH